MYGLVLVGTFIIICDFSDEAFRERLVDMEKENISLKQRLKDLELQLGSRKREVSNMEKKVTTLSRDNVMLQKTTTMYEQDRRDLEREVSNGGGGVLGSLSGEGVRVITHLNIFLSENCYSRLFHMCHNLVFYHIKY